MSAKNNREFQKLVDKYLDGAATPEEQAVLDHYYLLFRDEPGYSESLNEKQLAILEARMERHLFDRIKQSDKIKPLWPRIAAAASVLLVMGIGAHYLSKQKDQPQITVTHDVAPGTAVAILKTGGRTIQLDHTANGLIAQQNQTSITKTAGEKLAYTTGTNEASTPVYDTIMVPAGGRPYQVVLSDGSKITLNTATTLRYPQTFSKNRKEEIELISGEIYAEVVHKNAAPLKIKTTGQMITDIGTSFNISAYADEPDARTTLIEGAVKINALGKEILLSPGRQAIYTAHHLKDTAADIIQTTAWKNGLFRFNGERVDVIMRQLSRWYNIEVKYDGKITNEVFYARLTRNRNISEVLKMLERTKKVQFKVEGRRVTVSSKS